MTTTRPLPVQWTQTRTTPNGRHEIHCTHDHYLWPTPTERARLLVCPHCVGWWTWPHATR